MKSLYKIITYILCAITLVGCAYKHQPIMTPSGAIPAGLTTKQVQAAINEAMKQATVVMVAHRLNTLRKADRIYRIDNGECFAYDSYEQMMEETAGQAET